MATGRKTGGRTKGTLNKATADVKALARNHGAAVIARLAELAGVVPGKSPAESEAAQVAALRELLDRAYGKPTTTIVGDPDAPLQMAATVDRPPRETREQWMERRAAQITFYAPDGSVLQTDAKGSLIG